MNKGSSVTNKNNSSNSLLINPIYKDSKAPVSQRVNDLLSRMTLLEKIGQMTQLDITLINSTGKQKDVHLDEKKATKLLCEHHIGSFINGEAASADQWFHFMNVLMRISVEKTRLGIPIIYGIDHIHGASYLKDAVIFPHGINIGATFNTTHAYNVGWVTAFESSQLGHHWGFSPILDIAVNPLWPRFYESYGEDPHLASLMGEAHINGYQKNEEIHPYKCAATGKHFLGYSDPKSGWDRTPAHLSMQEIHEFHRPSFQKTIDAGLKTIMINSGEINGVPVHESYEILTKLLRHEMGFEGVVVTDWDDVGKLVDFHYTAENYKEATYDAVMAGIDVCMTPLHLKFNTSLLDLVMEGRISEERIDDSVKRILKLKFDLGLFENPYPTNTNIDKIGIEKNKRKALTAAEESIVLLKNQHNILPLNKPKKIGLFGPSSNSVRNLAGGWTIKWQGADEGDYPKHVKTIKSAIETEFNQSIVEVFDYKNFPNTENSTEVNNFIQKLNTYDILLYAGGETPYTEFVGNINDLKLSQDQLKEIDLLGNSNTPLVLILVQGRPRIIFEIIEKTNAIIFAGLPGFEGAEAIANILSGKTNPSGKLPFSYPMSPNHYMPYNHKKSQTYLFDTNQANHIVQDNQKSSMYPFGFGLSYTKFEYSDLRLSEKELREDSYIEASVLVQNTGKRYGQESVLWFTSTHYGKITRPVKELKHFAKIGLHPGESKKLTFRITPQLLSYPDSNGKSILEKTFYSVLVGDLKTDFIIPK